MESKKSWRILNFCNGNGAIFLASDTCNNAHTESSVINCKKKITFIRNSKRRVKRKEKRKY